MRLVKIDMDEFFEDFYINMDYISTVFAKDGEHYAELIDRDQPIKLSISAYNYILKNG